MHPKQMRELLRSPMAYMRFQTSGRLPEMVKPTGALIEVLQSIGPRDRIEIHGLTVDRRLGYNGSRVFRSAEQALQWCAPSDRVLRNSSWPAESWRLKGFREHLTVASVFACASMVSKRIEKRYSESDPKTVSGCSDPLKEGKATVGIETD